MNRIDSSRAGNANSANQVNKPQDAKQKQGLDVHNQIMRSNADAAQSRAYDIDDQVRVFQEALDGDGEEAEALAENGQLRLRRGVSEGGAEAADAKKSKSARSQAADASGQEDAGVEGASGADGAGANKRVTSKSLGTVETASLSQRQESLVSRLVTLPDDYRGLAAANTETTFDVVSTLEKRFASSSLWTRAPDTQRASMTDQIVNTFREVSTNA